MANIKEKSLAYLSARAEAIFKKFESGHPVCADDLKLADSLARFFVNTKETNLLPPTNDTPDNDKSLESLLDKIDITEEIEESDNGTKKETLQTCPDGSKGRSSTEAKGDQAKGTKAQSSLDPFNFDRVHSTTDQ